MPKPTLQNRRYFKSYLKRYRDKFTSGIQTCQVSDISGMFSYTAAGLSTTQSVKVLLIGGNDYDDSINVDNVFTPNSLVYFPASAGDYVNLGINSFRHQLYFSSEDGGIIYEGKTYGLNSTFNVGTKSLTVKALGGALVETQNGPTYSIGVSTTVVDEGESVVFTVNTTNVGAGTTLYFTTTGPVSSEDFSDNTLTGSFNIVSTGATTGIATITKTLVNDVIDDFYEEFTIQIRTTSIDGSIVAESDNIKINNLIGYYSIGVSTTTVTEDESVSFTVNTTNVGSGTTLYYFISGTVSSGDFSDNTLTGSFNIVSVGATTGIATISKTISWDSLNESSETFNLSVGIGTTVGSVVATSSTITVINKVPPVVTIGISTNILSEGQSVNFIVNTENVSAGTTLYYTTSGSISALDFTDNASTGSFVVVSTGATTGIATITKNVSYDSNIEGNETFNLVVRTDSTSGTIVATSSTITVVDVPPTYSIGISTASLNEGDSVVFTIDTTNVGSGTTLYYTTSGTVSASDFSNNSLTGSFNIVGVGSTTGIATITRTIINDLNVEGNETFNLVVRRNSTSGTIVATSSTITVSNVPFSINVGVSTTIIAEPKVGIATTSNVIFTLTTTGIQNGTSVTGRISGVQGTITFGSFGYGVYDFNSQSNNITINNNSASLSLSVNKDAVTEGIEQFRLDILNSSGTVIASSQTITILDTSFIGSRKNNKTFGPIRVNRDNGVTNQASDWYTICGLDKLPDGSKVALFIDTSGSMTLATVQASYDLLMSKLEDRNMDIIVVNNPFEDWITPFNTILDD